MDVHQENTVSLKLEDFNEICRCCLNRGPLTCLFELSYGEVSFVEIFSTVFGDQVGSNDLLPKNICEKCIGEVVHYYDFKILYNDSLKTLVSFIRQCVSQREDYICQEDFKVEFSGIVKTEADEAALESVSDEAEAAVASNLENEEIPVAIKEAETPEEAKLVESESNSEASNQIPETYVCKTCPNKKFSRWAFWNHKRTVHSRLNKAYTCDICNKSFMQLATLKVHKRIHSLLAEAESSDDEKNAGKNPKPEPRTYTCSCTKVFTSRMEYSRHRKVEKHAFIRRQEPCKICHKMVPSDHMAQHIRVHSGEKPFVCEHCGKSFSLSNNLRRHVMRHTGERPYVCDLCGKGFIQRGSLADHRRVHTGEKPYLCAHCGETFKSNSTCQNHVLRKHPDKVAPHENEIKRAVKQTVNQCKICDKYYSSKTALKTHMNQHGEKQFLCTHCGKGFYTKNSLDSHCLVHTGEKKFYCDVCGKSFARLLSFRQHQYIHSGQKPYTCKFCSKSFRQSAHLVSHTRTHTGEKPYACQYCGKTFTHDTTRTVHVRTHTGERPYVCDVCSKRFYHSSTMTKHRRRHFKNGTVTE